MNTDNITQEFTGQIDRKNAFLLYATFCGDVEQTAHALGVSPVVVTHAAQLGKWDDQLKTIIGMKKSSRPGDVERAINRAVNFVQAFRMRLFIERVIQKLTGLPDEELDEYLFDVREGKAGSVSKHVTTRPIADLTSALEKCHALTYLALNDTAQDRSRRQEQSDNTEFEAGALHVAIAKAMASAGGPEGSPDPVLAVVEG